jgi:hypothetical protein
MRVGRTADDIWEQMLTQFDHVEQFILLVENL